MVKNIIFLFVDGVLTIVFPLFLYMFSWQQKHMKIQSIIIIFLKFRLYIQWFIQSLGDLKDQAPRCKNPAIFVPCWGSPHPQPLQSDSCLKGLINPTKTPEIQKSRWNQNIKNTYHMI
jgi:hypothetical protein